MFLHKIAFFILLFCCQSLMLTGQEFKVKAALDPVDMPGFYKIPVRPELTAHAKANFSDLRITDNHNKQVPFIIRQSLPAISGGSFIEFPVLQTKTDSVTTTIEISCPIVTGNDHLFLIIANNAVDRFISISGSNNRQQWFIIKENILLRSSGLDDSGSFVQSVHFPFSKYSYYKIVINNGHTDPLNIIRAGIFTDNTDYSPQHLTANPPVSFSQLDSSNGVSYLTIHQRDAYLLDRIMLSIEGPKYYKRTANLYYSSNKGTKQYILSFEITSDSLPVILVNALKAKSLLIEINNKDNPPLTVNSVRTKQISKDLVAYLEKEKTYFIMAGDENLAAPQYDLLQFRDSIPQQLAPISYSHLQPAGMDVPSNKLLGMSYWLWSAMVITIFALGFLTFRLLSDMKRSGI